jgi:hypothetical protein
MNKTLSILSISKHLKKSHKCTKVISLQTQQKKIILLNLVKSLLLIKELEKTDRNIYLSFRVITDNWSINRWIFDIK